MKINQFRHLTLNDPVDLSIQNWSRCIEYAYVINEIKNDPSINTIHNTSCGGTHTVHHQFIYQLEQLGKQVWHSDVVETDVKGFFIHDILKPTDHLSDPRYRADCVINISTIEDFTTYEPFKKAFDNLLFMANKRLIITVDDNGREVGFLEKILGQSITPNENKLTGTNSPYPQVDLGYLKIILVDILK